LFVIQLAPRFSSDKDLVGKIDHFVTQCNRYRIADFSAVGPVPYYGRAWL